MASKPGLCRKRLTWQRSPRRQLVCRLPKGHDGEHRSYVYAWGNRG